MHLDSTLVMMEVCPRTRFKAALNGTAVKSIGHIANVKTIIDFVIKFPCLFDEVLGAVMKDALVLYLVHICKCRARDKCQARMVKLVFGRRAGCLTGTKTLLVGELCKTHHHKLVTAGERDFMTVTVILCDTLTEVILWGKRHYLSEYTFALIHLICSLHYYKMQRCKFKSRKKYITITHCILTNYLINTRISLDSSVPKY